MKKTAFPENPSKIYLHSLYYLGGNNGHYQYAVVPGDEN